MCIFLANINTSGAIHLTTPGGAHLHSTPLFLSYYDGSNSVVIGELQDSIGQVITSDSLLYPTNSGATNGTSFHPSGNHMVIYTNAFSGVYADILYDVERGRFEQDIILRQQPPSPVSLGLGPNVRLQVWTEFAEAPTPAIDATTNADNGLVDQSLDFGTLHMDRGIAFMAADGTPLTPTFKRWMTVSGRTFLVEEVPLSAIASELNDLPPATGGIKGLPSPSSPLYAADKLPLPARRGLSQKDQPLLVAKAPFSTRGLVLDYTTINNTLTNFTFQSDTTYYVSGSLDLYGITTIEGGTVVKTGATNGGTTVHSNLVCLTTPYRPAIFTVKHDDTAGTQISGSTGSNNLIVTTPLQWNMGGSISNLRFSYMFNAFSANSTNVDLWNCQFVNCTHPITANAGTTNIALHNVLMCMTNTVNTNGLGFTLYTTGLTIRGEHVTADLGTASYVGFTSSQLSYFDLTNSIIQATNLLNCTSGTPSVAMSTNSVYYSATPNSALFQSAGAGNYYLANNSPYRTAGTDNLNSALLALLDQSSTFPPVLLTNTFTNDTVLEAQAQRDTSFTPDLGYHYPAIDFVSSCAVSNATLLLTNGVVLAYYGNGIWLQNGGQLVSQGSPTQPVRLVYYNYVQEQATNLWSRVHGAVNAVLDSLPVYFYETNLTTGRNVNLRFTTVSGALGASYAWDTDGASQVINLVTLQDCEFNTGGSEWYMVNDPTTAAITLRNDLFRYPYIHIQNYASFNAYNCLFTGSNATIIMAPEGSAVWLSRNNAFDGVYVASLDSTFNYSAFLNGTHYGTLRTGDLVTNVSWVAGPLGNYYQPTTSPLINVGSTTANNLALYHYTVTTNQVTETNSTVDIGYHYVALGTNGLPLSSSGDGLGDYLKDSNGNGIYDTGDLGNWAVTSTCSDGVSDYLKWLQGRSLTVCGTNSDTNGIIGLQVYTPLK